MSRWRRKTAKRQWQPAAATSKISGSKTTLLHGWLAGMHNGGRKLGESYAKKKSALPAAAADGEIAEMKKRMAKLSSIMAAALGGAAGEELAA